MNLDWPAETLVQIALWASPDIEERLARMQALRLGHGDELLRESTQRRAEFLRAGTAAPLGPASELRLRDLQVIVTVKLPIAEGKPTARETTDAAVLCATALQVLKTAGLRPVALTADRYVRLMPDQFFPLPLFLHCLPFGTDRDAIPHMMRYRTMASSDATTLMPVFGDWKGTGSPVLNLVGRAGQLMDLNLFDSATNYNAVVAASSGSGKSFLANELLATNLSVGGRCWVIDSISAIWASVGGGIALRFAMSSQTASTNAN